MRNLVAFLVVLLGILMVPVATAGWWLRDTIVPTDAYVDTVAPLAQEPAVLDAVEEQLVELVMTAVDENGLVERTLAAVESGVLPPAVAEALGGQAKDVRARIEQLVGRAVGAVLAGPEFARAWERANRAVHRDLVATLSGESDRLVEQEGGTVDVRLGTLAETLRAELVAAGVPFASTLPRFEARFTIGDASDLARTRAAYNAFDEYGRLLPWVALGLLLLGVLIATDRRTALVGAALGSLVVTGLLALALLAGRGYYLDSLPPGVDRPAGRAFFDVVTDDLWRDIGWVAAAALVALVLAVVVRRPSRA